MTSNVPTGLRSRLGRKAVLTAGAAVMAGAGLVGGAGSASAASADISSWSTFSSPFRCTVGADQSTYWCLYYSPGAEGAVYKNQYWYGEPNLRNDYFQNDGYGSAGAGQQSLQNAASAENSDICSLAIYSDFYFSGNENWLAGGRGGNFTWWMRNQDKSARNIPC